MDHEQRVRFGIDMAKAMQADIDAITKPEPDPPTPEERYDKIMEGWSLTDTDMANLRGLCINLRDMIASLGAEVARLTETVNRLERGHR